MGRRIIRHGFILILLALLAGFAVPAMKVPRLGLSAHTIGLISGLLIIAVGLVWERLRLGDKFKQILNWMWLVVAYGNWLGTLLAAIAGGSQLMPIAGNNAVPEPAIEAIITLIIGIVSLLSIAALLLTIWGLRGDPD